MQSYKNLATNFDIVPSHLMQTMLILTNFVTFIIDQSRLMVVSRVAKKNAHAMTTESLFTCSKMFKIRKTKLTFLMLQSFLCSSYNFITFSIAPVKDWKVTGAVLSKIRYKVVLRFDTFTGLILRKLFCFLHIFLVFS